MNKNNFDALINAFPNSLKEDVTLVSKLISDSSYLDETNGDNVSGYINFKLLNTENIKLPNRVYFKDLANVEYLSKQQKLIYYCIFSRSCDGFVRENSLKQILSMEYEDWCLPYIIKLADEYIIEILDIIYAHIKDNNCEKFAKMFNLNKDYAQIAKSRMISYWNEYYRHNFPQLNNYIGAKLFSDYFGVK